MSLGGLGRNSTRARREVVGLSVFASPAGERSFDERSRCWRSVGSAVHGVMKVKCLSFFSRRLSRRGADVCAMHWTGRSAATDRRSVLPMKRVVTVCERWSYGFCSVVAHLRGATPHATGRDDPYEFAFPALESWGLRVKGNPWIPSRSAPRKIV